MRSILSLSIAYAVLLSTPASAATEFFHYKNGGVVSSFYINDPEGCIRTDITINAYESLTRSGPGGFEPAPGLAVNIDRVDWCNEVWLLSAFGTGTDVKVFVGRAMTSATVQGRLELFDYVGETLSTVEVDLSWTGNGPWVSSRSNGFIYGPNTRSNSRGSSRRRQAEAVGVVFYEDTNLVEGFSGNGLIVFEEGRFVTITPR